MSKGARRALPRQTTSHLASLLPRDLPQQANVDSNQNQSILTKSFCQTLFSAALDNLDFEDEDAVRAHHQVDDQ